MRSEGGMVMRGDDEYRDTEVRQSPVDDALMQVSETIAVVAKNMSVLEERVSVVCNDHPRETEPDGGVKEASGTHSGNSLILDKIQALNDELKHHRDRISSLVRRLDI